MPVFSAWWFGLDKQCFLLLILQFLPLHSVCRYDCSCQEKLLLLKSYQKNNSLPVLFLNKQKKSFAFILERQRQTDRESDWDFIPTGLFLKCLQQPELILDLEFNPSFQWRPKNLSHYLYLVMWISRKLDWKWWSWNSSHSGRMFECPKQWSNHCVSCLSLSPNYFLIYFEPWMENTVCFLDERQVSSNWDQ